MIWNAGQLGKCYPPRPKGDANEKQTSFQHTQAINYKGSKLDDFNNSLLLPLFKTEKNALLILPPFNLPVSVNELLIYRNKLLNSTSRKKDSDYYYPCRVYPDSCCTTESVGERTTWGMKTQWREISKGREKFTEKVLWS